MNDASTVDGNSICDGGGSGFDSIDASIGDNNASASDIMASIPTSSSTLANTTSTTTSSSTLANAMQTRFGECRLDRDC